MGGVVVKPLRDALAELRDAEDCLYAAANELARLKARDPLVDQCASLAKQCDAIAKVIERRPKK